MSAQRSRINTAHLVELHVLRLVALDMKRKVSGLGRNGEHLEELAGAEERVTRRRQRRPQGVVFMPARLSCISRPSKTSLPRWRMIPEERGGHTGLIGADASRFQNDGCCHLLGALRQQVDATGLIGKLHLPVRSARDSTHPIPEWSRTDIRPSSTMNS